MADGNVERDEPMPMQEITRRMSELSVLSFRKIEEMRKLTRHFNNVINHPDTQSKSAILNYLKNLNKTNKFIFTQNREEVEEVEYIFTTERKSTLQRQRFNSLPVSEVPELLKTEFVFVDNAKQVHICTDCNVEIEMNDEEPLMESLQKHFNLEVHLPKLKRESIDVSEPILVPNMSRRLSAMECGELPNALEHLSRLVKPTEKVDRAFSAKLETALIRHLPDNSEASIDAATKFYQATFEKLCQEVSSVDFSGLTSIVAPIIMSIKDNVNQNFAADANKNFENEDSEQAPERPAKNQVKKYRYYGPIESIIVKLLINHKLLSLVDDRTGKPAFFCIACEYYTLRFRYDSVLSHVFSETHIHNLACILQADKHIPFITEDRSIEKIIEMNQNFLFNHHVSENSDGFFCALCKSSIDSFADSINHILDENHLAKLSDKLFRKAKGSNPDGPIPDEWGTKNLDWTKYLAGTGKALSNRDHVVIENFIKPSGKIANYCSCCDMTLKGPRQVLFNHIRQKKHLRNAAPHKLAMLYKNHCRPMEFYASFGNYYMCSICPQYVALPSFASIVEHFESDMHVETIAKMVRTALYSDSQNFEKELLSLQKIDTNGILKCQYCDLTFQDMNEAITHVLSSIQHQNNVIDSKFKANKGDIISVYMNGHFVLHNDGATFTCVTCKGVFNSLRSLLNHLVYAEHFVNKPNSENVFRFYLELKHNINLLARNKYDYYEFGKLKCGVCAADLEEGENAKKHVVSTRHRENMGASYVNVNLDVSTME